MRQVIAVLLVTLMLSSVVSFSNAETANAKMLDNNNDWEYGVCIHLNQYDNNTIRLLDNLNVKWVRIDWIPNEMDSFVNMVKTNDVKILAILDHNTMRQQDFTLLQWQKTLENIMQTETAKKVDAWEIWNEPNMDQFYLGYMDGKPQHYFDMLKIAYQTIKANSPNATVLVAGLSPYYSSFGTWVKWLTDFSNLSPQNYFDYQGVHLYDDAETNQYIINQTKTIINIQDIWVTEIGQPSASDSYSEEKQSEYIHSNFLMLQSITKNPVFWYQLKDEHGLIPDKENHFGLYTIENKPKLASEMYSEITSSKPSPSVPELSWFIVVPLFLLLLTIVLVVKHRKTTNLRQ